MRPTGRQPKEDRWALQRIALRIAKAKTCDAHPAYKILRAPNNDCKVCWFLWYAKIASNLKLTKEELIVELEYWQKQRDDRWKNLRKETESEVLKRHRDSVRKTQTQTNKTNEHKN